MNPIQHGEVFVTDDGGETDLDLGHYERFIDENLSKYNNFTTGKIYQNVINNERRGDYLGSTVQVIPHITDEIKTSIRKTLKRRKTDIIITEIGGTVGDIESLPFLEAIRQFKNDAGKENVVYIHVTYIPYLKTSGELKSKPTQHSVKELRSIGIQPDIIICRSEIKLDDGLKAKISLFCDIDMEDTIEALDAENLYEIPLKLQKENLDIRVLEKLNLKPGRSNLNNWKKLVERIHKLDGTVKIGIVGKYTELKDAYISIVESLSHSGYYHGKNIKTVLVDSQSLDKTCNNNLLDDIDGILVPYGFGHRGIKGKINAIKFARENNIPFFGICMGMQCAVIEFAKNVLKLEDANSSEFDPDSKNPIIDLMVQQRDLKDKGGTMRLGSYKCRLKKGSKAHNAYGHLNIEERHRHRFELNNDYRDMLEKAGMSITGINPDKNLAEIVEIDDHPWFVAVQFHPEFKSRPDKPHPLFKDFIEASIISLIRKKEKGRKK